jgi:hypothetical protein
MKALLILVLIPVAIIVGLLAVGAAFGGIAALICTGALWAWHMLFSA